jgi:ERCC4-type nuclease
MPLLIKIDCREHDLFSTCEKILALPEYININANVKIIAEGLPLGDIIICGDIDNTNGNNIEKLIIERKTLEDLAASIRDGRYAEQSFRLNECSMHNHNIIYAIEGDLRKYKSSVYSKNKIDKNALLSAMTSINYYKGFSVMRTQNVQETAEWIIHTADKIARESKKKAYYMITDTIITNTIPIPITDAITNNKNEEEKEEPYSIVVVNKRVKKDNVTPQNIGEIMLAQIPGISSLAAIAIMKKFGTMQRLIEAIKDTSNKTVLQDIVITATEKKPRKLNKTNIAHLYKYLLDI